jgi:hypothetical protein
VFHTAATAPPPPPATGPGEAAAAPEVLRPLANPEGTTARSVPAPARASSPICCFVRVFNLNFKLRLGGNVDHGRNHGAWSCKTVTVGLLGPRFRPSNEPPSQAE